MQTSYRRGSNRGILKKLDTLFENKLIFYSLRFITDLEQQLVKLQRLNVGLKNISYDLLQFPEREFIKVVFKKGGV